MATQAEYVCHLSDELAKKAEEELGETPEKRRQLFDSLRRKLKDYPGLTCPTDDRFILKFLRARKFDETRTLDLILQYFRARNENRDIFDNFRPSAVKTILDDGVTSVLPGRDSLGRKVMMFRPGRWNPETSTFMDMFRTNLMTLELLIEDEETQISGFQMLADCSDMSVKQASYISPTIGKKIMGVIQEAFPARFKGLNYVNEPTIISYIFPMIRPFMKEKLASRLHFHGQAFDSLHQQIPSRMLPTELGGALEGFTNEEWKNTLLASENKFADFEQYKLVEDAPGVKGTALKGDAMEGMTGVFRKLNVD